MCFHKFLSIFLPKRAAKNVKILVIDDGEVDSRVTCSALEQGGYTALKANRGTIGFELAKKEQPQLIVLDYNLPDMTGPDLCKLLKMHDTTQRIPVLFLTSMETP